METISTNRFRRRSTATSVLRAILCVGACVTASVGWAQQTLPPPPAPQVEDSTPPAGAAGAISLSQQSNARTNSADAVQPLTGALADQQPASGSASPQGLSPQGLEQRVRELEAIVQQMQARSGQSLPVP